MLLLPAASLSVNTFAPKLYAEAIQRLSTIQPGSTFFGSFSDLFYQYIILVTISFLAWRIIGFTLSKLQLSIVRDIEQAVFAKLIDHSYRFHVNHFGGALVAQTNRLRSSYIRLFDTVYFDILNTAIKIFSAIIVLLFIAPFAALILSCWVLVFTLVIAKLQKRKMHLSKAAAKADSKVTAALADAITNISNIKSFGHDAYEEDRFNIVSRERYRISINDWFSGEKIFAVQSFMMFLVEGVLIWSSVAFVLNGTLTIGTVALTQIYLFIITGSLWNFGRTIRNIEVALSDAAEMTEVYYQDVEVKDKLESTPFTIKSGAVEFKNVRFSYPEQPDDTLFSQLNLTIRPGEKVGLAGPSGGGKTTITKLILRFMDIDDGMINIDGIAINQISQALLRQQIAYVPQEPILFHRSIKENIAYGRLDANDTEIEEAAKKAFAHEFIVKLEKGYDTLVGERGVKLSGGQKQRIAIARAILKDAPIIVLDEATSALDSESENEIQNALWELMKDRTAIVIAHRLSTIQKMDRIVVLSNGAVTEEGTHSQLIQKKNGLYAKLWKHQSGGFLAD